MIWQITILNLKVGTKAEHYKKLFIVKLYQNLWKRNSLEMLRFFLCSVYIYMSLFMAMRLDYCRRGRSNQTLIILT